MTTTIGFTAPSVKQVLMSCHDRGHDKLWLVRDRVTVYLTTPDLDVSSLPEYLGPGFIFLLGMGIQPNVDPISVFHKTLKMLHAMSPGRAKNTWVELQFADREFRVCLTAREDGRRFVPRG